MTPVEEITNNVTLKYVKGAIQNGATIKFISKSFGLSTKKVEEIIQKIKSTPN
jgi:hypothetical protein